MNKIAIFLTIALLFLTAVIPVCATATQPTITSLSDLSETECLAFIQSQGVSIPKELVGIESLGLFVKNVITCVEINPDYNFVINYHVSRDFANSIKSVVNAFYGNNQPHSITSYSSNSYSLQYNTVLGEWNDNYINYNCYAYALNNYSLIGTECFYYPGQFSNSPFLLTQYVFMWADNVENDLGALGYECVFGDLSYPEIIEFQSDHTIICLRKCSTAGLIDFHFMVLHDGHWDHKPGNTAPLRFNYLPYQLNWFNEHSFMNVAYEGDRWYTDSIEYIAFSNNHSYTSDYTTNDYHEGNLHYYYMKYECEGCGHISYGWESRFCTGSPCISFT